MCTISDCIGINFDIQKITVDNIVSIHLFKTSLCKNTIEILYKGELISSKKVLFALPQKKKKQCNIKNVINHKIRYEYNYGFQH